RTEHSARIRVHQHLQQHPRIVRAVPPPVPFVGRVKTIHVEGVHHIRNEIRQVAFLQPVLRRRRQQITLFRMVRSKSSVHRTLQKNLSRRVPSHRFSVGQTPSTAIDPKRKSRIFPTCLSQTARFPRW